MAGTSSPSPNDPLSKRTFIFGLRLWVIVGICIGAGFVLLLFLISLCVLSRRRRRRRSDSEPPAPLEPAKPVEIILPEPIIEIPRSPLLGFDRRSTPKESPATVLSSPAPSQAAETAAVEVSHLGWGRWFTLRELEEATGGFSDENVIGQGGYGIVYHGIIADGVQVAVKNLLNNKGQAEREFKGEVEAIGRVRHKNLVRLLGYCAEGTQRLLVYEFVDNGNLEQWLHGEVGPVSPLSWDIRLNIIIGTAKGLMYLHEALEPKVVHRDVKSSNILLDSQWTPKVSDFGLAKLLATERTYVTTRVMGTFGYVAPEYASTGMLNERSDVFSFGILVMEIITGRKPVDYARPPGEVNLVEWLKSMVSNRNSEGVLDPRMSERPSSRALKRTLLVALRCVDPDAVKRPKMGQVVHMLEVDDFPYRDERRGGQSPLSRPVQEEGPSSRISPRVDYGRRLEP